MSVNEFHCNRDVFKQGNPFHPYNPPKLTIELVPGSQWEDNLRSRLPRKDWDALRKACYARAGHVCEICGGKGRKHPVECHEIWHFDDELLVQRLDGLISLCPSCHQVKHIGFAFKMGRGEQAIRHLAKVNGWSFELADAYAIGMFDLWKIRSTQEYTLNLSWLDDAQAYIEQAEQHQRQTRSDHAQRAIQIIERERMRKAQQASEQRTERPVPKQYGAWS